MTIRVVTVLTLMAALATTACDRLGQAMTAHTDVVARAAGHELKVDRTAALININPQIPAQPDVVVALANMWVDYILLATAAAQDSTMRNVSLAPLTDPAIEAETVEQLLDQVTQVDTAFTDDELRRLFEQHGPGTEVRARHILLSLSADAPPAQRDSVTNLARQLRQRAQSGADFAALARQYSGDQGSAQLGGDLGFFGRGRMLKPFEDAAFALQPGQISDIVETPYGLHIIKLEERRNANFEEQKAMFREDMKRQRLTESREKYLKDLTDPLNVEIQSNAFEVVKDLASRPGAELRGRAASRALVSYRGGAYTAADFVQFLRRLQPQVQGQVANTPDEQLKGLLEMLTRNEIMVQEARRRNITMPQAQLDSMQNGIYGQLVELTRGAGLLDIQPQQGETKKQAIERQVNALLEATVRGEQGMIPLGPLAYGLRDQFGGEIFEQSVPAVLTRVQAARPAQPSMPGPQPPIPPDEAR